jgi:hypothetical protein
MRSQVSPLGFLLGKPFNAKEGYMKKIIILILMITLLSMSFGCNTIASYCPGPAPNSGDGVSDGSGLNEPFGSGPAGAPNSGDGIPDGSGF